MAQFLCIGLKKRGAFYGHLPNLTANCLDSFNSKVNVPLRTWGTNQQSHHSMLVLVGRVSSNGIKQKVVNQNTTYYGLLIMSVKLTLFFYINQLLYQPNRIGSLAHLD